MEKTEECLISNSARSPTKSSSSSLFLPRCVVLTRHGIGEEEEAGRGGEREEAGRLDGIYSCFALF